MPQMAMKHDVDPKEDLLAKIGNIDGVDVFNNSVLVALYIRPERTKTGIYVTQNYRDEDRIQGKSGLIVKMGANAFVDDTGNWFKGASVSLHDWVIFRPADGWPITINNVACRLIDDTAIRGKISSPDVIW